MATMSLPDDMFLLQIFSRVKDVASLFRCAVVCKRWRDILVSKRSCLRHCIPDQEPWFSSPFAGFFTQQKRHHNRQGLPAPYFVPGPGPRPVLGPRGLLSSFVPGMGGLAVPLTSRQGLLLVRAGGTLLMVCDLFAGTFKPLPPLPGHLWGLPGCFTGYAMLTAADCSSSEHNNDQFPFFKVMIIVVAKYPMCYDLYTYSSAGGLGWNKSSATPGPGPGIYVKLMQHNAIVRRGVSHWFVQGIYGFHFIHVSAKTGRIFMTTLVDTTLCNLLHNPNYDEPYLSLNAEGRLAFLCLRTDGTRLDIRTLSCNRRNDLHIKLEPPSQRMNSLVEQGVVHKCLGEKNGMIIIIDNHKRIYLADARTGVMQEITDCPRDHGLSRREIVPLEMDWPGFFISRLGAVAT